MSAENVNLLSEVWETGIFNAEGKTIEGMINLTMPKMELKHGEQMCLIGVKPSKPNHVTPLFPKIIIIFVNKAVFSKQ